MPSTVQLGKSEDLFLNQTLVGAEAQNPSPRDRWTWVRGNADR